MARRRRTIYQDQARATAALRSSPERRGLIALIQQAQDEYASQVAAARTSGRTVRGSIREARPEVAKIYEDARRGLSGVSGDYSHPASQSVAGDFSKLGPAAGSIAEAARAEADASQRRNTESETRTRLDLVDQSTRSAEGETFAIRAAGDKRSADFGKIGKQLTGLDQEEGLAAATELERLLGAAAGRSVTRRGQDKTAANNRRTTNQTERSSLRTAGIDPDTGKLLPGKAKPNKGRGWAEDAEQRTMRQTIGQAKKYAKQFAATGTPRHEAAGLLSAGAEAQGIFAPEKNPVTGKPTGKRVPVFNKDGTKKTTAALPAIKDELALSVALDVAYDGHLSKLNQRRLHRNGYRVGPLGLTTYHQWRKRQSRRLPAKNNKTEQGIDRGDLAGPPAPNY